jgi:prevent-host-death family protein
MKTIGLSEFRANCHSVINAVGRTRRPVLITRRGSPIVEIRPIPIGAAEQERLRAERNARDLELINRFADELNEEALDGLEFQAGGPQPRMSKKKRTPKR